MIQRPTKANDAIDRRNLHLSLEPAIVRALVAAHSHGNVRLQNGLYYTKADIDAEIEALRGYRFVD